MKDEEFNQAVAKEVARREHDIRSAATAAFQAALDVCRESLDDGSKPLRLQAAALILKHCAPVVARKDDRLIALRHQVEALGQKVVALTELPAPVAARMAANSSAS